MRTYTTWILQNSVLIVLIAILGAAFLIRFVAYDHPLALHGGEGFRDYLTAKHIVHFGEFPAAGPWNQTLPHLGNSPLYFYILAVPLLFSQSWHMLEVAFILLACLAVLLVYLLARDIFDQRTALLSAAVYAFAPVLIAESATFVWQPYVMEPLLLASVYTGYRGYTRSDLGSLLMSIALCVTALSVHLAVFGILPIYGLCMLAALYTLRRLPGVMWGAVVALTTASLVFFLPRILSSPIFAGTPTPVPERGHFVQFVILLLVRLSPIEQPPITTYVLACIAAALIAATVLYLVSSAAKMKKASLLVGIAIVLVQCGIAAGFGTQVDVRFVLPASFALAITCAALIQFLIGTLPFSRVIAGVPVLAFIALSFTTPYISAALHKRPLADRPHDALAAKAADALAADLEQIRIGDGYPDHGFFSMRGYRTYDHVFVPDMMWSALEERFDTQLVRQSGNSGGLAAPDDRQYMVVLCADGDRRISHYAIRDCLNNQELSTYTLLKPAYLDPALNVFILVQSDMIAAQERD